MHRRFVSYLAILFTAIIPITLLAPPASAEDHIITTNQLHQALMQSAAARQKQVAEIDQFLSSGPARRALKQSGFDLAQVEAAVPSLNNQELARLASETNKVQNEFAAGALSNENLTYIVIAIAAALLVLLIVEA